MKGLLVLTFVAAASVQGASADSVTWNWVQHPTLAGSGPGNDGYWGTADDMFDASFNPNGNASQFGNFSDGRFGTVSGTFTVDFALDVASIVAGGFGSTMGAWTNVDLIGETPFGATAASLETGFVPNNVNSVTTFDDGTFTQDYLLTWNTGGVIETTRAQSLLGAYVVNGQDYATTFGSNPALVTHFDTLIPLLPANWTMVALAIDRVDIIAGPFAGGFGYTTATAFTTAVPVPGAAVLFAGALISLYGRVRRSEG